MRSAVEITHGGDGEPVWDEASESMIPPPATIDYVGPASIKLAGQTGKVVDVAGDPVTVRGYVVSIPAEVDFPVTEATRVEVTACPDTPTLVGTQLAVRHSDRGDADVVRRLLVEAAT